VHTSNLDVARRYLGELWSLGRLEAVPELVAPECTVRDPLFGECAGAESLAARIREMRTAFPGLTWRIDEVLADAGPQLALTWSACMRSTKVTGLLLLRFENGKLTTITSRWDPRDLLRQRPQRIARGSTPAISTNANQSTLDAQWDLSDGG
jgi:hypothetical protein